MPLVVPLSRILLPLPAMRLAALLLTALALPAAAQRAADPLSLDGRSALSLEFGLTGSRDAVVSPTLVRTYTNGEVGAIRFKHWVRPVVAVEVSAGVLSSDQSANSGFTSTNAILPVLFGLSVSPRSFALGRSIRPYVSAAGGPYIHASTRLGGVTESASTETAFGGRFGLGANLFVTRHFLLDLEGDYHTVGGFQHTDALTTKATGFGMTFGLGFAWGGR